MSESLGEMLQSINNSELRISLEKILGILGFTPSTRVGGVSLTGNVTGNLTGNVTGDVLGDVVGDVTGNLSGDVTKGQATLSADEDLDDGDFSGTMVDLNGSSATVAVTNFTPTPGKTYVISCSDATNAVTLTASTGVTLDGTNNKATFDAADECLVIVCINATTCLIVENIGAVTLASA